MTEQGAPPILVLVGPQDIVNIAGVVRVAKNFGFERIRLVKPEVFDPWRIEGIAHNTADLVSRITLHETLAEATQDCVYISALTARERTAKRSIQRPRPAAADLVGKSTEGPVALVAGREDRGLTNEELDHCHALVTIPTDAGHKSLNLAQAVGIFCYEVALARLGETPLKPPRREAPAAPSGRLELMFRDWERTLWAIEFFKTRRSEVVMRSVREAMFRADLDWREASLLRAMALETVRFLERRGVELDLPDAMREVGRLEEGG
ncbi:MAG: tRNA (cytosine(32)/uridine(32)-2'-O)-methyltransferase TrmJ [Gemmatimonadales bacterium]|nr:tRNA (cytosine(32)/uridine(32)-2'-O)-methyltransferase TrmJ [Gemmatimonadales bacterium]